MKVICAGMSKTGTKSLHAALEELGYEVYDFPETYIYFYDVYLRMRNEGWRKEDFRKMYENVDATCDGPAYYFWEQILEAFPDAKVILTMRENDEVWLESMERQLTTLFEYPFWFYNIFSSSWRRFCRFSFDLVMLPFGWKRREWNDRGHNIAKAVFKQVYRRHIAHVINTCPKDQLLVYNVKDGWRPLCQFLRKPQPNKPFPNLNIKSQLTNDLGQSPLFQQARKEALKNCTVLLILGGISGMAFWKLKLS